MNRLLTTAAFIHSNMPLGTPWNHPAITNEDAYDVAGYLSSRERPQMSGLEKDYPKKEKKAVDCPYPPLCRRFPPGSASVRTVPANTESAEKDMKKPDGKGPMADTLANTGVTVP